MGSNRKDRERRAAEAQRQRVAERALGRLSPPAPPTVPMSSSSSTETNSPTGRKTFWNIILEYRWGILKALPLGVFLPMMLFFGSVGPDDFAKNYAGWANKFGLADWADWLSTYATGPEVFAISAIVSLVYLLIAFVIPVIIRKASSNFAAVFVPIVVAVMLCIAMYGQYDLMFGGDRHLTTYQQTTLKESIAAIKDKFKAPIMVSAVDNPEANNYAIEIMTALKSSGLPVHSADSSMSVPVPIPTRALDPGVRGVFFEVADTTNPPDEVKTLLWVLASANIKATLKPTHASPPGLPPGFYLLTIGLK